MPTDAGAALAGGHLSARTGRCQKPAARADAHDHRPQRSQAPHDHGRRHVHGKRATERVRTVLLVHHAPGLRGIGQCYYKTAARGLRSGAIRADGLRVLRTKLQEGGSGIEERARFGPAVLALGTCWFERRAMCCVLTWQLLRTVGRFEPTQRVSRLRFDTLRLRLRGVRSIGRRLRFIRLLGERRP